MITTDQRQAAEFFGDIAAHQADKIGARLKVVRQLLDISRRDFAAAVGVSARYLHDVESGAAMIEAAVMARVWTAFPAVNRDWCLTGHGTILLPGGAVPAASETVADTVTVTDAYDQSNEVDMKLHNASLILIAMKELLTGGLERQGTGDPVQLLEVVLQLTEVTTTYITEAIDVAGNVTFALSGAH